MKKVMFGLAAAAAISAFAIESANIVGYNTYNTDNAYQPSFGACFVPLSGGSTYKLGSIKPTNFDPDNDMIQLIDPTTLGRSAAYVYLSAEIAAAAEVEDGAEPGEYDGLIGWWDASTGPDLDEGIKADNVDIDVGQAFLGKFDSGNDVEFLSSGEAPTVSTSISTDSARQPFFASYIPKTIKLGQIVPEDFDPDNDMIQVIDPATLGRSAAYVYLSAEVAAAAEVEDGAEPGEYDGLIGWWDASTGPDLDEGIKADNVNVNPGDAFLGKFDSGNDITFNFPSSLAE